MTIFGPDVSSFQRGLNVRALPHPFILMKVTEGTYYTDAEYPTFLAQARASRKRPIAYHFVTEEDPGAQAAHIAANIGDKSLSLMLDMEPQYQTGSRPTVATTAALIDRCRADGIGLRPRLIYLPAWYWQELGSPSLSPFITRGQELISSAYLGGGDYPGDNAAGWKSYGGMTPLLYQYTETAYVGGTKVGDMNAFKGTIEDLSALLDGEEDVTPEEHNWLDNVYAAAFNGGPSCGRPIPEDAGHFPAGASSMFAHLDYMTSLLEGIASRSAPVIDPAALAAAIAPLLNASATPEAIADAVISHINVTVGPK